jgi:hypothetical protein
VQGIFQGQSGPAFGFGNVIFTGNLAGIPLPVSQRTPDRWFNIDAGFERSSSKKLASNVRTMPTRFSGIRGDQSHAVRQSGHVGHQHFFRNDHRHLATVEDCPVRA